MTDQIEDEVCSPNPSVIEGRENEGRLGRRSAADQVFSIQELASMIFTFLDGFSWRLFSCALVCRMWTEAALDQLWKHLDSIAPLFKILFDVKPRRWTKPMKKRSVKPNENVDWAKFQAYARRVKSINIGPESLAMFHKRRPPLDISLFTNHPFGDSLFRQLRRVKLNACCSPCLQLMAPFLSPSITRMELELKLSNGEAGPLFDSLQHHAPNIKELVVTSHHAISDIGLPLSQWISSLQHLTKLSLPPHYQSKDIVAAAGGLKELKIFNLVDDTGPLDEDGMQMEFLPDTFPMLRVLEWNSTLPKAFQLLQPSPRVEALESLYLDSACNNTPVEFVAFARLLGEACPRLSELWLNLFPDLEADPEPSEEGLEVDALHGLAPCKELVLLQIGHPFPIKLRERDVRWIGATWKNLDCLVLCPDPDLSLDISPRMGTSISLLPLLANHLPNLTTLGLWFAGEFPQIIKFSGDLYPQHQFKNLENYEWDFPRALFLKAGLKTSDF